jgi:hypothetical protein
MLAYNLLSLLRAVHLRSPDARHAAWEQLRDRVRDALIWHHLREDPPPGAASVPAGA